MFEVNFTTSDTWYLVSYLTQDSHLYTSTCSFCFLSLFLFVIFFLSLSWARCVNWGPPSATAVPAADANMLISSRLKCSAVAARRARWWVGFRGRRGAEGRSGAVCFLGRCQRKKTGRWRSWRVRRREWFQPGWCTRNFTGGFQVGRNKTGVVFRAFSLVEEVAQRRGEWTGQRATNQVQQGNESWKKLAVSRVNIRCNV